MIGATLPAARRPSGHFSWPTMSSPRARVEGDVFGVSDFPQAVTLLLTVVCFSVIVGLFLLTRRAVDPDRCGLPSSR